MNLNFTDFFQKDFDQHFYAKDILCFQGKEYPFLFFSLLFDHLKTKKSLNINFININEIDFNDLTLKLEQSFLGISLFYWLGNISDFKKKKELIAYLNSYNGCHRVGFFIDEQENFKFDNKIINCQFITNADQFNSILFLWNESRHKIISLFLRCIFQRHTKISLDQACIFANYAILLGTKYNIFLDNWLDKIIVSEQSFFTLSKYFFALDAKNFFKCWDILSQEYPAIFWTTYWSEQLYRAACFIKFANEGKNLQAKQIAYRLPFSFLQTDWKRLTFNELRSAHQFIYDIDISLKNSASDVSLDLFYSKFFSRQFA